MMVIVRFLTIPAGLTSGSHCREDGVFSMSIKISSALLSWFCSSIYVISTLLLLGIGMSSSLSAFSEIDSDLTSISRSSLLDLPDQIRLGYSAGNAVTYVRPVVSQSSKYKLHSIT